MIKTIGEEYFQTVNEENFKRTRRKQGRQMQTAFLRRLFENFVKMVW